MAASKGTYAAGGLLLVCFIIYGITTVVSLSCAGKGKWGCAQTSGILACVTGLAGAGLAFAAYKMSAGPRM